MPRIGALVATVLAAATLGTVPAAEADTVLGQGGRPGISVPAEPGGCKYRVRVSQGILEVGTNPPAISGPNLRRGRRDITRARYAVFFMNGAGQLLARSTWSGWLRASDSKAVTWSGYTAFDGDWTGGYFLDVRVEWWKGSRFLGWRAHRITKYNYFDQYNVGGFGPMGHCQRWAR